MACLPIEHSIALGIEGACKTALNSFSMSGASRVGTKEMHLENGTININELARWTVVAFLRGFAKGHQECELGEVLNGMAACVEHIEFVAPQD